MKGWMKGGREVKKLAIHFNVLASLFLFHFTLVQSFCVVLLHLSNTSHPSSSLLPLQRPKQSLLSHSFLFSFSSFPSPSYSRHLFLMPLFFLCHPLPNRCHALCPPPAPPPSFPPLLLLLLFLSFSTWGTPGSQRRWSISILPLGFLSPVWGRPCLPSPSGSEHHYWPPHASHPGRQQMQKSPASRCASGSPG